MIPQSVGLEPFLPAAVEIGRALCREAIWDGAGRHCNWMGRSANEVTQLGGPVTPTATALGPDRVEVAVPELYRDDPVGFIAWILDIDVMTPQTEARVWVNTKSKTVLIHGDVQISPVVISHKSLKVEVAGTPGDPAPFAPIGSGQEKQQLDDLLNGLQALKVSNDDVIAIVRELYYSGNLHAVYEEH